MGRNAQLRRERKLESVETTQSGKEVISKCTVKYVHCAPRKIKLVADQIRNRTVGEALELLQFLHRPSAVPHVQKCLASAIANAENLTPNAESLIIGEIRVEGAPMMKRIRPASMGRAVRVRKRLSHLHIKLIESQA